METSSPLWYRESCQCRLDQRLRTAGVAIGERNRTRLAACNRWREGDADRAVSTCRKRTSAGVRLSVRRAGGDARDAHRRSSSIGHRDGLGRAGGVQVLIAEIQARRREVDAGRDTRAGERYGLRASGRVVRDRNRTRLAAGSSGREGDGDRAFRPGRNGSAAGIGLRVRRARRDAGNAKRRRPRIGERDRSVWRWACSAPDCRKLRLVGARVTAGTSAFVPVPDRLTIWGLPVALSVMVIVPGWLPVAVGVKVTVMVQLAAGRNGSAAGVGLRVLRARRDAGDVKRGRS